MRLRGSVLQALALARVCRREEQKHRNASRNGPHLSSLYLVRPGPSIQVKRSSYDKQDPCIVADSYQEEPVSTISLYAKSSKEHHDSGSCERASDRRSLQKIESYSSASASASRRAISGYDDHSGLRDAQYTASPISAVNAITRQPQSSGPSLLYSSQPVIHESRAALTTSWPSISESTLSDNIVGTPGIEEKLDSRYQVRNYDYKKFFQPGRVFSTLWTDPTSEKTNQSQTFISEVIYGEKVHTKIRRFVIIQQRDKCYNCLPVTTYGGRGYKKSGIELNEHSQIYSHKCPKEVQGMKKKPLKVILSKTGDSLEDTSLINYGRIYTVESNVKVLDVGVLDEESQKRLQRYYRQVNFSEDLPLDSKSQREEADLAGTGTSFLSVEQSYQSDHQKRSFTSTPGLIYTNPSQSTSSQSETRVSPRYPEEPSVEGSETVTSNSRKISSLEDRSKGKSTGLPSGISRYSASEVTSSDFFTTPTSTQIGDPFVPAQRGNIGLAIGKEPTVPLPNQAIGVANVGDLHPSVGPLNMQNAGSSNLDPSSPIRQEAAQPFHTIPTPELYPRKPHQALDGYPRVDLNSRVHEKGGDYASIERPTSSSSSIASTLLSTSASNFDSESSLSSVMSRTNLRERLVALLYEEEELQSLYIDALCKTTPDKFERNLRRGLAKMSVNLRSEATSSPERQTAKIIQTLSRNVAHIIRGRLEDETVNELEHKTLRKNDDADSDGSNDGDLEPADDLEDDLDALRNLEAFVLRSDSMRLLKDSLRRFIYPDPAQFALSKTWPFKKPKTSSCPFHYEVNWDTRKYLSLSFPASQKLGTVLTLTGNVIDAQAASCQDYISATWKGIGPPFLQCLEILLQNLNNSSKNWVIRQKLPNGNTEIILKSDINDEVVEDNDTHSTDLGYRSIEKITIIATHAIHSQIISILVWICAAVRPSTNSEIMLSSAVIETSQKKDGTSKLSIRMSALEGTPQGGGTCWHSILPYGVIAKGFRIRDRKQGQGLEISFADMALLSHALDFVEVEGGLVLHGLQSLLIPIEELRDDNALQWHYEDKRHHKKQGRRTLLKILNDNGGFQWLKELDPLQLSQRRCFLGWAEEAVVAMGTESHLSTNIRWSGAKRAPRIQHINTHTWNIGASGAGFVNASKGWVRERVAMRGRLTFDYDKDIHDTFNDDEKKHVIVYDNGTKTAWCLPQPNIVLHLVYRILLRRNYRLFDGEHPTELQAVPPDIACGGEALKILKRSLRYRVVKDETDDGVVEEPLSCTIKQVWHLLNTIRDKLESVVDEFEDVGEGPPRTLYGVELSAVLLMLRGMPIRRADVHQPWVHLTSEEPLVLFCKGIGQPIIPITTDQLCRPWKTVPHGQNFLVATAAAVKYFLHQQYQGPDGSRLHANLKWLYGNSLIQSHSNHHERKPVSHVQYIQSVRECSLDKQLLGKVRLRRNSCFIFSGSMPRFACLKHERKVPRRRLKKDPPAPQCSDIKGKSILLEPFEFESASGSSPDSERYLGSSLHRSNSTSSHESQEYVAEASLDGNVDVLHQPVRATISVLVERRATQLQKGVSYQAQDMLNSIPRYVLGSVPKSLKHKKRANPLRNMRPEGDESHTQEART
ncbi:hypothetical protein G7Y89_g12011 [Cudoniella acicularis]|uniref:DUF6590 domain-containing protein n=1 Tax=Cudoniella acicularis TaxID=354080 RepID=A0A8H4R9U2_9HELO|nr:hypothetical protein G7Y89_g12011 [Cudoniella acicularis]